MAQSRTFFGYFVAHIWASTAAYWKSFVRFVECLGRGRRRRIFVNLQRHAFLRGDAHTAGKPYSSDELALSRDGYLRHKWTAPKIARYHADKNWSARTVRKS